MKSEVINFVISVVFYTTATTGVTVDDITPDELAFVSNTGASNCHVTEMTSVVMFAV